MLELTGLHPSVPKRPHNLSPTRLVPFTSFSASSRENKKPAQTFGTQQNANQTAQTTFQDAMKQLQANPAQIIRQAGYNVPEQYTKDPQSAAMYLLQSGQVGGPMMRMIAPMLSRLTGKR